MLRLKLYAAQQFKKFAPIFSNTVLSHTIYMKPATKHIHFKRGVNPVFSRNLGVILKLMVGADRSFPTVVLNMVEIALGF